MKMLMGFEEYIKENYKSSVKDKDLIALFHISKYDKITKSRLGIKCFTKPIKTGLNYFFIEVKLNKTFISTSETLIKDVQDELLNKTSNQEETEFSKFKVLGVLKAKDYDSVKIVDKNEYYILDSSSIKEVIHLENYEEALKYYNNINLVKSFTKN
jgi:hypothetical protein